jgi:hypothetical protein
MGLLRFLLVKMRTFYTPANPEGLVANNLNVIMSPIMGSLLL